MLLSTILPHYLPVKNFPVLVNLIFKEGSKILKLTFLVIVLFNLSMKATQLNFSYENIFKQEILSSAGSAERNNVSI